MISSALATTTLLTFTTATASAAASSTAATDTITATATASTLAFLNSSDLYFNGNISGNGSATLFFENASQSGSGLAAAGGGGMSPANGSYQPVFPSYIRTTSMVFCILIMCLGVVGNVMVPIVIFKTKDMRNSTNIFLVNLSFADLMVLLVCTPTVLVEVNSRPEVWVLGEEMCKAVPFVELTVAHASVLTILAISFERYYAICMPLKAGYICTKTRASLICLLAWFVAAVFTSPILAITQFSFEEYFDSTMVPVCFSPVETFFASLYFILTMTIFFFLPLIVLIVLYAMIAKTLMDHPNLMAAYRNNALPSQSVIKYRKQVVVMLGTVVLAFFVCLLPFRMLTLWIILAPAHNITDIGIEGYYNLIYFCRIMFYINSAINPILYNIMSSKFRGGFLRVCGFHSRMKHKKTDINRKNTFNTTSSTNTSSQHTSESLFSRYSSKHKAKHDEKEREKNKDKDKEKPMDNDGSYKKKNDVYVRITTVKEKDTKFTVPSESFV